ncbi:MAG: endonuclease/exonuclease/phosphatase family protein [Deltaproteobacteria bacterium]|nr:MAG: endonuclease/exonuclease/phosphatase family protein [Deltaproteobacteria bacterium]
MNFPIRKVSLFISIISLFLFGCSSYHNIREINKNLKEESFTVMTYNIRVACGREDYGVSPYLCKASKKNLLRVAAAIRSIDPDVIGLQEVKGFCQAKFLAKTLNLNYAYSPHPSAWWGLTVLSKFKILKLRSKQIHSGLDPRVAQVCAINIGGKPITFINVHYHLGDYEQQVGATMRLLKDTKAPVVLMGDLNRKPWHYELKPIRENLIETCEAVDTIGSRYVAIWGTGYGRIDYVFADPNSFEVIDVGLIPKEHWPASDHVAYFARVAFK